MRLLARESRVVVLHRRDRRHPAAGTAELYVERVAREIARQGHPVVLVTSRPEGAPRRDHVDGYDVVRLGGPWAVRLRVLLWLLLHRRSTAGVVDSQDGVPFFSPLVVRATVPVVLLVHHVRRDVLSRVLSSPAARVARWTEGPLTRWAYRDRTVAVLSPAVRVLVRRTLQFQGPVRLVPGGADRGRRDVARAATPRVVVVGRLTEHKGLDQVVEAVATVARNWPGTQLHLVGDGPAKPALDALARRVGTRVVFHGQLSDERRDDVLGTAWVTVSASDGGDWGLGLLGANALGVPALARRVPGVAEAVQPGRTGWLVDDGADALATGLRQAFAHLSDPDQAAAVARQARSWAARFTWEQTADGMLQALRTEGARRRRSTAGLVERRTGNDLVVVLSVPTSAIGVEWETGRRAGDVWVADGARVRGLLTGTDESDVPAILDRLAIDRDHPEVRVLVARHSDLLGLTDTTVEQVVEHAEAVGRPVLVSTQAPTPATTDDDQDGAHRAA